jgi:integrase
VGANAFAMRFRRARKKAGVTNLRYHDLRDEATSRLVESRRYSDVEVMAFTGHKSVKMLARYNNSHAGELTARQADAKSR